MAMPAKAQSHRSNVHPRRWKKCSERISASQNAEIPSTRMKGTTHQNDPLLKGFPVRVFGLHDAPWDAQACQHSPRTFSGKVGVSRAFCVLHFVSVFCGTVLAR